MAKSVAFLLLIAAVAVLGQFNQNPFLNGRVSGSTARPINSYQSSNNLNPQYNPNTQYNQNQFRQVETTTLRNDIRCPDKNGRYPDGDQCDAYIECLDGVGEKKLCPDGMMYNTRASFFSYPCDFPNKVDCAGRPKSQPASATEDCPHLYGYFRKSVDPAQCGEFTICSQGKGHDLKCPDGLAFSSVDYLCDWPDLVTDCDAEAYLGFRCPEAKLNPFSGEPEYTFYRSPNDCRQYFLCTNGRPRRFTCAEDEAYDDTIQACNDARNVTSCGGGAASYRTTQSPQNVNIYQRFNDYDNTNYYNNNNNRGQGNFRG